MESWEMKNMEYYEVMQYTESILIHAEGYVSLKYSLKSTFFGKNYVFNS